MADFLTVKSKGRKRMRKIPVKITRKAGWDKGPVLTIETEYKVEQVKSPRSSLK